MDIGDFFTDELFLDANKGGLSSYIQDFLFFVLVMLLYIHFVMISYIGGFFAGESSGAFMQFSYYVHALNSGGSLYWDHYLMLATQEMPMSPLLSPVTFALAGIAWLFDISSTSSLAYLYASGSYMVQILCCFSMYLFLRFLGLSRLAAIVGALGYAYNYFSSTYGIVHGYYRISALALMPLVLIYFFKLFSNKGNTLYYFSVAGFLLGLAFVLNGDVKPTIYFIPVLILIAYAEGYESRGALHTTYLLAGVLLIGALLTLAQYYPTFEALQEGVRNERTAYLPVTPLRPYNTLLGFSQNPFSMIIGFFFPHSFFEYYKNNLTLGIAYTHMQEQKFTYGIYLFLLSTVGVFYRTRTHFIWAVSLLIFVLYILGSSTPLWPVFGFISKYAHIRYPTRATIMIYFLLSIYAAYGIDVILKKVKTGFYPACSLKYARVTVIVSLVISATIAVASFQISYGFLSPLSYTSELALFVARHLWGLLIFILLVVSYVAWHFCLSSARGANRGDVNIYTNFSRTFIEPLNALDKVRYLLYILLHAGLVWWSIEVTFYLLRAWLLLTHAGADTFSVVFFVEATLWPALIVFMIFYLMAFVVQKQRGFLLPVNYYMAVFILTVLSFNLVFLTASAYVHIVHIISLFITGGLIYLCAVIRKRLGQLDLSGANERPRFINFSVKTIVVSVITLVSILFLLFIFSGLIKGYAVAPYIIWKLGPVSILKEFLYLLIALILFFFTVVAGHRGWPRFIILLLCLAGTYLFFYTDSSALGVVPALRSKPEVVFKRDAQLSPIYEDGKLNELRVFIPRDVRRNYLSPELGFAKSLHTYCCTQYEDGLRFAFGQIIGPKSVEGLKAKISGENTDYSHPFWRLYNVGYIVDTFNETPELLPTDPDSYERISDMVLRLKHVKPVLYFMDSFKVIERDDFIEDIDGEYALDMEEVLYLHDQPSDGFSARSGFKKPEIEIKETKSGLITARVRSSRPGFIVFSEVWAPSWTVYVNDKPARLLRAYGMLQAVQIGQGTSRIRFEYNTFSSVRMKLSVLLSALAFIFVLLVVIRRLVYGLSDEVGNKGKK